MKSKLKRALEVILSVYIVLSLLFVLAGVGLIGWDFLDSRKTGEHRVLPDMQAVEFTVMKCRQIDEDDMDGEIAILNEIFDYRHELLRQGYEYEYDPPAARIINLSMGNAVICFCIYMMFRAWKVRPRRVFGFMALGGLLIRLFSMWRTHVYLGDAERMIDLLFYTKSLDFRYFDKPQMPIWLLIASSIWVCGVMYHSLPDTNPAPEDLPPEKDDE